MLIELLLPVIAEFDEICRRDGGMRICQWPVSFSRTINNPCRLNLQFCIYAWYVILPKEPGFFLFRCISIWRTYPAPFFNFAFYCFTLNESEPAMLYFERCILWKQHWYSVAIKEMIWASKVQLSWCQASSKIFLVAPIIFLCLSRRASLEVNWKKRDMLDPALFTKLNISDSNNIVHLLWDVLQKSILGSQLQNEI